MNWGFCEEFLNLGADKIAKPFPIGKVHSARLNRRANPH
jgi:hypothetical protein